MNIQEKKDLFISVIAPMYNNHKYIKNFIKSLVLQKYKNFELILIDDGSTDESTEIAEKELKNVNFKYTIIKQENKGQSSARNIGIDASKGDWCVFVDSDDTIQSNYLSSFVEVTKSEKCEVVFCDINRVTDKNIFEETSNNFNFIKMSGNEAFAQFFMHKVEIGPVSLFINTSFLKRIKLKFNENLNYSEEFIFINKLLYSSPYVVHLLQKNYNYCLRPGSVSTGADIDKVINSYHEILKSSKFYSSKTDTGAKLYNKYAIPRWIIATARFSAKKYNYKLYITLLNKLNYKKELDVLLNFPDKKIKLASCLLKISPHLAYRCFKWSK